MKTLRIRDWDDLQQYKDRSPKWIKLHRDLLTSIEWVSADNETRALMVGLMLIACQCKDGEIPWNEDYLCRVGYFKRVNLKPLIDNGFLIPVQNCTESYGTVRNDTDSLSPLLSSPLISSKGGVGENFVLPDWIGQQAWDDFVEMRKSIKKPLTPSARKILVAELLKLMTAGHMSDDVLNQSTLANWQGVFPIKEKNNERTALHQPNHPNFGSERISAHQPSAAATAFRRQGIADAVQRIEARRAAELVEGMETITGPVSKL